MARVCEYPIKSTHEILPGALQNLKKHASADYEDAGDLVSVIIAVGNADDVSDGLQARRRLSGCADVDEALKG